CAGYARARAAPARRHRGRGVWNRRVCPIAAACTLRRCAWGLEPRPRQALGVRVREAAVDDHDRDALRPGFSLMRRHREGLCSRRCCRPRTQRRAVTYYEKMSTVESFATLKARLNWDPALDPAIQLQKENAATELLLGQKDSGRLLWPELARALLKQDCPEGASLPSEIRTRLQAMVKRVE